MAAFSAAPCSHSGAPVAARPQRQRPARCRAARAAAGRPRAALWTPPGYGGEQPQQQQRPKGWDRPWIQANGQPIMAPRTADMAGDPFGLLLRQRIVFLGGEVDDFGADAIVSQLLLLDQQDATKDIKLFINSPGACRGAGAGRRGAGWASRGGASRRQQARPGGARAQRQAEQAAAARAAAATQAAPSAGVQPSFCATPQRGAHRPPHPIRPPPGGSVTAGMGIYDAMMLCRADVHVSRAAGERRGAWQAQRAHRARFGRRAQPRLCLRAALSQRACLAACFPSPTQPGRPQTYCFGLAASMGAFLLGAGRKGKRFSMPNSRIMIHQPLGGASGQVRSMGRGRARERRLHIGCASLARCLRPAAPLKLPPPTPPPPQAVDIEIQAKEIMYHKANLNRIMADCTGQPLSKIEEDTDRDRCAGVGGGGGRRGWARRCPLPRPGACALVRLQRPLLTASGPSPHPHPPHPTPPPNPPVTCPPSRPRSMASSTTSSAARRRCSRSRAPTSASPRSRCAAPARGAGLRARSGGQRRSEQQQANLLHGARASMAADCPTLPCPSHPPPHTPGGDGDGPVRVQALHHGRRRVPAGEPLVALPVARERAVHARAGAGRPLVHRQEGEEPRGGGSGGGGWEAPAATHAGAELKAGRGGGRRAASATAPFPACTQILARKPTNPPTHPPTRPPARPRTPRCPRTSTTS
jgi:ATP-dependent protease ClpP protease subunit